MAVSGNSTACRLSAQAYSSGRRLCRSAPLCWCSRPSSGVESEGEVYRESRSVNTGEGGESKL